MNENYITVHGKKKSEDIIMLKYMFKNLRKLGEVWSKSDFKYAMKYLESEILKSNLKQIVFFGVEYGWKNVIKKIKENHKEIKIKVICNTSSALLYYDYERNNFFEMLALQKEGIIDNIAFLKKDMYECYTKLGYNTSYLKENIVVNKKLYDKCINSNKNIKKNSKLINIGIYILNYVWDKNIFNQLSVAKFVENSNINYFSLDERMDDFLKNMKIMNKSVQINEILEKNVIKELVKNDINVSCTFTEYFHVIPLLSLECLVPCIVGNNSYLFSDELKEYIVIDSEDNPIEISEKIKKCLENKEKIIQLYKEWKFKYNEESKISINEFLNK
ncbi:MAG: hypothetical protein RR290_02620 [Clostridia bacterium]